MPKKKRFPRAFLFALTGVLFLNILHFAFLFERGFKPFTLEYTVSVPFDTFVWHSIKPKFKKDSYRTEKVLILPNTPTTVSVDINEPQGIQILSVYWSRADKGLFEISNIKAVSNGKELYFDRVSKCISYSSRNLTTQISEGKIGAYSQEKANGWIVFNTMEMDYLAKNKLFSPLSLYASLLLFAVLFALLFFLKFDEKLIKGITINGSNYEKIRGYLLLLWAFLLPFWSQVSHVLLGIATAIFLWGLFSKKISITRRELRPFYAIWFFFFCLLAIDAFFHIENLGKDIENYIYFILTPFVFLGLKKPMLKMLMRVFQASVILYVILLFISVVIRYFEYDATETFQYVLFSITDSYWHTSYLAGLIIIAHFFALKNQNKLVGSIVLIPITLVFFYLTEARLPALVLLGLSIILLIGRSPSKTFRNASYGLLVMAGVAIYGYVYFNKGDQLTMAKEVLHTKTGKMDVRMTLWDTSIDLIKEQPLTGIGRKNIRKVLTESLPHETKIKFRNYNVHNQYLEWWLGYGLLAVIVFFMVLLYPLFFTSSNYWWFMVYFGIAILVETYLARQAGVIFFSFWYSFFIIYDFSNARISNKGD